MREVIIGSEYELNPHSATKWAPGKVGYSIHPKRLLVFSEDDRLTRTRAAGTFWPRLLWYLVPSLRQSQEPAPMAKVITPATNAPAIVLPSEPGIVAAYSYPNGWAGQHSSAVS